MEITVYTAILGGYDKLRAPAVIEPGVRYVCLTDTPASVSEPWETMAAPTPFLDMQRNSRAPKIMAHQHIHSEYSIWHDGCFYLAVSPSDLISRDLDGADMALYRHPCRQSVWEEAQACEEFGIGEPELIQEQVMRYRDLGLPNGLWAGGMVIRKHTKAVERFNCAWWSEYLRRSSRDQLSLPYALWSSGVNYATINGDILTDSSRLHFHFHAASDRS
ncbi:MAG: hypothetical protein A2Z18_11035 [Armatimonadetes bacterium RBG_16_58_9]|nr:MAG: hypothetical protein A2Z18_11035 [Armatimonadetes bacterium RBG_16_58_9]